MHDTTGQGPGLRLHLGCGPVTPRGWVNVDASLGARLARIPWVGPALSRRAGFRIEWSREIVLHDLRTRFPWADGSAEVVYSSHTLEHLTRDDGRRFLRECHRVLAPGGVLRIVVPDLAGLLAEYEKGAFSAVDFVERLGVGFEEPGDTPWKRRLAPLFRFPHRCMYDAEALVAEFARAGFSGARVHPPELSRIRELAEVERPERADGSLIVECAKADSEA